MANNASDDRFYKPATLWKWFGISSICMLVFTLWMLLDDFGREWKGYQQEFFSLRQKKYDAWIAEAKQKVDENKVKELNDKILASNQEIKNHEKDLERLRAELVVLKTKEKNATVNYQAEKGVWDVEKYQYEASYGHLDLGEISGHAEGGSHGHAAGKGPKGDKALADLQKHWMQVETLKNTANQITQQKEAKQKEIDAIFANRNAITKELKVTQAEMDQLVETKKNTELTLMKLARNAPVLDMANPVFRLQQYVIPTIRDDIFFSKVQKVDRCTTCHMAIDIPGFEKEKQPFRTHPKLDLMLSGKSPHPVEQIGCTVCHEGRGSSTDFIRSAHTPRNEEQKKEWQRKYGWHEMHHVIEKMIPLQYTEGKCRTCHKETEYVPKAEKLTAANQTMRSAGCFGCHRIEGWDHMRKPAPSLKKVKGKLTRDWIVKWVRDPKSFNEFARMPSVFHQSNIRTEEHKEFQEAELFAITDYLLTESENYTPNVNLGLGSAERGKELFKSVGCLGCHQVDDFGRDRGRYTQAPDLSTVGSKVSKEWLTSWLRNPRHYWAETTMPSLRLSDGEIGDLAAFLLGKKNTEFEGKATGTANLESQKKVLRLYLMRDPKLAPVTNDKVDRVLSEMKPEFITHDLGKRAIQRYGCYGCHDIKGFEGVAGIGTELTDWGSKPLNKLDFGLMHDIGHSNVAWFKQKMTDSRAYDIGIVKEYLDLLRMPKFDFNDKEKDLLTTAMLGLTSQKIDPPAAKKLSVAEAQMEGTMRVVHQYNCQGCHVVEQLWTALPDDDPNKEAHDKTRFDLEGRVLAHYSEDETLGPPPLVSQGARTKSLWLHNFLHNPGNYKMRDKLTIRMPTFQFANQEVNKIITGWAANGKTEFPTTSDDVVVLTADEARDGQAMLNGLQCLNCHTAGRKPSVEEMEGGSKGLAPDFIHANRRLHQDWIVNLLKDPQKMIPGTRMPGFWPSDGPSPLPNILGGDSQKQMEVLAKYIRYLGQNKSVKENSR